MLSVWKEIQIWVPLSKIYSIVCTEKNIFKIDIKSYMS